MDGLGLDRVTAGELADALRHGAHGRDEPFIQLCEVATALGGRFGLSELLDLFQQLRDTDAARAVVFAVAELDANAPPVRSFLLAAVDDSRALVAAEAIDGLAVGGTPLESEAIDRLLQHPSPYVRGALLRYLARTRGRAAIDTLMAALKDDSHIIRENAIDELEELEAREAMPALRRMLDDSHRDVRAAARYAIQSLADG